MKTQEAINTIKYYARERADAHTHGMEWQPDRRSRLELQEACETLREAERADRLPQYARDLYEHYSERHSSP